MSVHTCVHTVINKVVAEGVAGEVTFEKRLDGGEEPCGRLIDCCSRRHMSARARGGHAPGTFKTSRPTAAGVGLAQSFWAKGSKEPGWHLSCSQGRSCHTGGVQGEGDSCVQAQCEGWCLDLGPGSVIWRDQCGGGRLQGLVWLDHRMCLQGLSVAVGCP